MPFTFLEIAAIIGGIVTVGFAALSGFFTWRNGAPQISDTVINTYKARVEQLEERVTTCENLHRENLGEVGRLKGILEEKDKRIAILEAVDIKGNPDMMSFMKSTSDALTSVKRFFDDLNAGKFTITSNV